MNYHELGKKEIQMKLWLSINIGSNLFVGPSFSYKLH